MRPYLLNYVFGKLCGSVIQPSIFSKFWSTVEIHETSQQTVLNIHNEGYLVFVPPRCPSQLNKQRRHLLKDKFKGFNTEFEELQRVQEQWSIPDPQLRSRVRANNADMLISLYADFYRA